MGTQLVGLFLVVSALLSVSTIVLVLAFVYTARRNAQPNVKLCGVLMPNPFSHVHTGQSPLGVCVCGSVAGVATRCLRTRSRHWLLIVCLLIVVYLLFWNWGMFAHYAAQEDTLRSQMAAQHATKHAIDPVAAPAADTAGAGGSVHAKAKERKRKRSEKHRATLEAKAAAAAMLHKQRQQRNAEEKDTDGHNQRQIQRSPDKPDPSRTSNT